MANDAVPELRPLRLSELLDRAVRIYRANFFTFIAIIAVVQIPIALLSLASTLVSFDDIAWIADPTAPVPDTPEFFEPGYLAGMGAAYCLLSLASVVLVQGFATAAMTGAIADHYLGRPVSFTSAYRKVGRSWLALVLASMLAFLVTIGLIIWFIIPCIGWVSGLGMLSFFWVAVYPLVAPIVVLERQRPGRALRRAWELTRQRFWPVVGFVGVFYLFNMFVVGGLSGLIGYLFQALGSSLRQSMGVTDAYLLQTVVQSLVNVVSSLLYFPLQLAAVTLLYFDLRVRLEGFDLALLSARMAGDEGGVEQVVGQAPRPEGGLITWREIGYFALLSLAPVALGLILFFGLMVLGFLITLGGA